MGDKLLIETDSSGVATLRMNRPETSNAIDDDTIDGMSAVLAQLNNSTSIRAVVIRGTDETFCSGVDIAWMQHMSKSGTADDARRVAHLLVSLRNLHKPTIAVLEGPCVGGGIAIAACCDIAIASEDAYFALPAVHLGTVPSVIAPFIIEAIGINQARRFLLTGERFNAEKARDIGLIHAVCMTAQIDETLAGIVEQLLQGAPRAQASTKEMLNAYAGRQINSTLIEDMARRVTDSRRTAEAQEGIAAFLEKRSPTWKKT